MIFSWYNKSSMNGCSKVVIFLISISGMGIYGWGEVLSVDGRKELL